MQQVIGDGNSQSACRLTAFVNDHPQQATAHDAFIIHAGVGRTTSYPARGFAVNSQDAAPHYFLIRRRSMTRR